MRALAFMLWESFGREMGRAVVAGENVERVMDVASNYNAGPIGVGDGD